VRPRRHESDRATFPSADRGGRGGVPVRHRRTKDVLRLAGTIRQPELVWQLEDGQVTGKAAATVRAAHRSTPTRSGRWSPGKRSSSATARAGLVKVIKPPAQPEDPRPPHPAARVLAAARIAPRRAQRALAPGRGPRPGDTGQLGRRDSADGKGVRRSSGPHCEAGRPVMPASENESVKTYSRGIGTSMVGCEIRRPEATWTPDSSFRSGSRSRQRSRRSGQRSRPGRPISTLRSRRAKHLSGPLSRQGNVPVGRRRSRPNGRRSDPGGGYFAGSSAGLEARQGAPSCHHRAH
jgi:hypothetical protein